MDLNTIMDAFKLAKFGNAKRINGKIYVDLGRDLVPIISLTSCAEVKTFMNALEVRVLPKNMQKEAETETFAFKEYFETVDAKTGVDTREGDERYYMKWLPHAPSNPSLQTLMDAVESYAMVFDGKD